MTYAVGPQPARYLIVGEAWGEYEEKKKEPFVGPSGNLLWGTKDQPGILPQAGIGRHECRITNVVNARPPRNKLDSATHAWWVEGDAGLLKSGKVSTPKKASQFGLHYHANGAWYGDIVADGLEELAKEIRQTQPKVIIALGNLALWALTGLNGVAKWRGSELWTAPGPVWVGGDMPAIPVVPTYHPAYVLRLWPWKAAVTQDIRHRVVRKGLKGTLGIRPDYDFVFNPTPEQADERLTAMLRRADEGEFWLATDLETRRGRIACVGIGESPTRATCFPLMHVDGRRWWDESQEGAVCEQLRTLLQHPNVRLFNQNMAYDVQYFMADPVFQFRPRMDYDTMIAQHLLFPGAPKDLAYQASLYCDYYVYWKDEGKEIAGEVDELRWWEYNCVDCVTPHEIRAAQMPQLRKAGFVK